MEGKRVLVTGASSGIGLAATLEFARMGAEVVMHVRDEQRGQAARELIARETGSERTGLLRADFSDLCEVRAAAERFTRLYDRLDVLVANAGAIYPQRQLTIQGNEITFQVNHLSHFLLSTLLEPLLRASAPSRVVTLSSDAHWAAWRGVRLDDPTYEHGWSPFGAYANAKLANIMFCYEHARRFHGTGVTSTVMHPGLIDSGFGAAGYGVFGSLMHRFSPLVASTPEVGADTLVWLASSHEVEGATGRYFYRRRPRRSSPPSHDLEAQRALWALSAELTDSAR
ncbi:MAG: SDR family NAD(P)-dependent oxidoreductase [Coriobacteriia bacterium]|nr:SDR family NAD(P)-dependent oxidoreductase [Coriobacteriia bacterium]